MPTSTADKALERLKQGNRRFRTGCARGAGGAGARHKHLIEHQDPFAIILGCSDSRVPTEIIFDTGLGDLFVVRVAGNVASKSTIASIEYAVVNLGTKLVVVLAHQRCGAVGAAIAGGDAGRNLSHLLEFIRPALEPPGQEAEVIIRRNARINADRLISESKILCAAVKEQGVRIVTGFFHFTDGVVEFD